MRLKYLHEGHWSVTPAPYLDPKGKAKPKKDYSILLKPSDRKKFIKWSKKKKHKKKK